MHQRHADRLQRGAAGNAVDVTNGIVPDFADVTLNSAGVYEFWAVYSGDSNNTGSTSECGTETVVIDKNTSSTSTQVKKASDDSNVLDDANLPSLMTVYDTATLATVTSDAGGTVTYYYEKVSNDSSSIPDPAACTNGTPIAPTGAGNAVDVTNGIVPDSADVTLNSAASTSSGQGLLR